MVVRRTSLFILLAFFSAETLFAQQRIPIREDISVQLSVGAGSAATNIQVELPEVASEAEVLAQIKKHVEKTDKNVIVSSDLEDILVGTAQLKKENVALMPLPRAGKESKAKNFSALLRAYPAKVVTSAKADKWGLVIVTFNTLVDSYVWIHASHLSSFERTANIVFTVMTAVAFGLNKDSWSHATKPFYSFFSKFIYKTDQLKAKSFADVSMLFTSSFALSSLINLSRVPFLSFDRLVDGTVDMHLLTVPIMMSLVSSVASFAWSENIASIDERIQPASKWVFRRVQETRSILLGYFAATAMLFSPSVYGLSPWGALATSGIVGLVVYLNNTKITTFIETRFAQAVMKGLIQNPFNARCADVFAN